MKLEGHGNGQWGMVIACAKESAAGVLTGAPPRYKRARIPPVGTPAALHAIALVMGDGDCMSPSGYRGPAWPGEVPARLAEKQRKARIRY